MTADLPALAAAWAAQDPDPDTRAELAGLLAAGDLAALRDRFAGPLQFGTAGLRGALGAGPNRMNRSVVRRAAGGLAAYLRSHGAVGPVVVGYDARHKSDVFAADTARVLQGAGRPALLLPRPLPTPVLAYAVRRLGCSAGVMVTASHNPAQDNGYKIYLSDGAQIVPPADAEIATAIEAIGSLADLPFGPDGTVVGTAVLDGYIDAVVGSLLTDARDVRVAYTALHGVGSAVLRAAFDRAGFAAPAVVAAQDRPDPDFPTVAFPNPEEPGVMDLLLATAAAAGADIALANDPDADRLATAVPDRDGGWRVLSGDELGVLVADHVLRRTSGDRLVVTTIVSGTMLGKLAATAGVRYAETLTGFKWIVRAAQRYPRSTFVFGYEEALGYCVGGAAGPVVRDKDGIGAALMVAEMAAAARRDGRSLLDRLDELARAHGLHATDQISVRVDDVTLIQAVLRRLRAAPPRALAGRAVTAVVDLLVGGLPGGLPPTDGLVYRLGTPSDGRVVIRPSGTEPKLKAYLETVVPVTGGAVAAARSRAATRLTELRSAVAALITGSG